MSKKIKAKGWSIIFIESTFHDDKEEYNASYEWESADGKHEVSKWFDTYQAAYGWLSERVIL